MRHLPDKLRAFSQPRTTDGAAFPPENFASSVRPILQPCVSQRSADLQGDHRPLRSGHPVITGRSGKTLDVLQETDRGSFVVRLTNSGDQPAIVRASYDGRARQGRGQPRCLGRSIQPLALAAATLEVVASHVRYIGNKRKLIPFIREGLQRLGIEGRTACDPFAGTASVARFLKGHGYSVVTGDIMSFSFALQWAYVVVDRIPRFRRLPLEIASAADPLGSTLAHLNALEPRHDFIFEHYSPEGSAGVKHGRRYFTPKNAARIDAIRRRIWEWREAGHLDDDEHYILIAALLEAADRVANTTGVYAAYVKSWQPNAARPLRLRRPNLETDTGRRCRAFQRDALDIVRAQESFDLLYLDPPYNSRQYAGYYHIPEIIAEGWFAETPKLRGKTGLPEDGNKRSDWSRRGRCERAFAQLVGAAPCRHILMSYNSEGIISERCIEAVLRERGQADSYRRLELPYKRYRSDRDSATRRYKGDRVTERLYYVRVE